MKKFLVFIFLILIFSSCGTSQDLGKINSEGTGIIETETFIIGGKANNYFNIYGNIKNNNTKNIISHISGTISTLNCEVGNKVNYNTVIAKISPDPADVRYKSNSIQVSSLNDQMTNLQSIKSSTLQNFNSQKNQLRIQKEDLESKLIKLNENLSILKNQKNISGDDISVKIKTIEDQIKNLEDSKKLVLKNKEKTLENIKENLENLKGQIYNTGNKSIKRMDEIFGVSNENKDKYDRFADYLGASNTVLKSEIKAKILYYIENISGDVSGYKDDELSDGIKKLSDTLKDSALVVKDSVSSIGSLSQIEIDGMYTELLAYSDGLLTYKMNFDKLKNAIETTSLTFDTNLKEIEAKLDTLKNNKESLKNNTTKSTDLTFDSNINGLETKIDSIRTSLKNIKEQEKSLEDTKNTNIKQLNSQITSLQDSISKTNLLLSGETLKAGINGIVKASMVDEGNLVGAGKPICIIVPEKDSKKLEIYSPNKLKVGMQFKYLQNGNEIGTGTIISESPDRNAKTQNYTYEGNIDFSNFTPGDYLDIKILTEVIPKEIWVPIHYVSPRLDGYYVNVKNGDEIESRRIEVGKMNNGEIQILSGADNGETLTQ